jgi:hypothetical protein
VCIYNTDDLYKFCTYMHTKNAPEFAIWDIPRYDSQRSGHWFIGLLATGLSSKTGGTRGRYECICMLVFPQHSDPY